MTHQTQMSHEDRRNRRRQAAQEFDKGVPVADICRKYSLTPDTLRKACTENGVQTRRTRVSGRSEQVVAAAQSGRPKSAIAKEFGITRTRVYQIINEAKARGVKFPG